jgi:hypothetical protein
MGHDNQVTKNVVHVGGVYGKPRQGHLPTAPARYGQMQGDHITHHVGGDVHFSNSEEIDK